MDTQFDPTYLTKMSASFLEELSEIEKKAGIGYVGRFLAGGARKLVQAGKTVAAPGGGMTMALGGRGAVRAGGVGKHMSQIHRGGGGGWGGAKALMRSRYGQMAAVPVAGYGAYRVGKRVLGGGQRRGY